MNARLGSHTGKKRYQSVKFHVTSPQSFASPVLQVTSSTTESYRIEVCYSTATSAHPKSLRTTAEHVSPWISDCDRSSLGHRCARTLRCRVVKCFSRMKQTSSTEIRVSFAHHLDEWTPRGWARNLQTHNLCLGRRGLQSCMLQCWSGFEWNMSNEHSLTLEWPYVI